MVTKRVIADRAIYRLRLYELAHSGIWLWFNPVANSCIRFRLIIMLYDLSIGTFHFNVMATINLNRLVYYWTRIANLRPSD